MANTVYDINISADDAKAKLEELSLSTKTLRENSSSIEYIYSSIQNNWEVTDANSDIASTLKEVNKCIVDINEVISPVLDEFKNTLEILILAHQETASKEIDV